MTDQQPDRPDPTNGSDESAEEAPRGTLVLMLIYLVIIIGLWGSLYLILLQRS